MIGLHFRKSVFRNLVMISQLGISVMTPIFLCVFIGYQIDSRLGTIWTIPLLILGVLAGGRCAWQLVLRMMEEERRENEKIRREELSHRAAQETQVSRPKQPSRINRRKQTGG